MLNNHLAVHSEDRESVVQLVRRAAAEECSPQHPWEPWMDDCVAEVVTQLWASRLKTFVPLLAVRHVRCCIRAGSCNCGAC